jgi:hypothetical protein
MAMEKAINSFIFVGRLPSEVASIANRPKEDVIPGIA